MGFDEIFQVWISPYKPDFLTTVFRYNNISPVFLQRKNVAKKFGTYKKCTLKLDTNFDTNI